MTDSDGDGVDDLSEIQNSTDPLEPCHNLLDTDGDGLNNYFENNTGCRLSFGISPGNMTLDTYLTLWNQSDSDNGGVSMVKNTSMVLILRIILLMILILPIQMAMEYPILLNKILVLIGWILILTEEEFQMDKNAQNHFGPLIV